MVAFRVAFLLLNYGRASFRCPPLNVPPPLSDLIARSHCIIYAYLGALISIGIPSALAVGRPGQNAALSRALQEF